MIFALTVLCLLFLLLLNLFFAEKQASKRSHDILTPGMRGLIVSFGVLSFLTAEGQQSVFLTMVLLLERLCMIILVQRSSINSTKKEALFGLVLIVWGTLTSWYLLTISAPFIFTPGHVRLFAGATALTPAFFFAWFVVQGLREVQAYITPPKHRAPLLTA